MKTIKLKLNRKEFETLVLLYETSDFIYTDYDAVKIVEDTHYTGTIEIQDTDKFIEFLNDKMDMEWLKVDKFGKGVDFIPIKYRNTFNIIRSIKQKLTDLEVK